MADDDKPAFDPSQPFQAADEKPAFDPNKPFEAASPQTGSIESAVQGAVSGASAGWAPELAGLGKASGMPDLAHNPYYEAIRMPIGAARLAYEHLTGQPGPASEAYQKAKEALQQRQSTMQKEHPYAYGAGELGGALVPMALAPEASGPGLAARLTQGAKLGAGYGAASGASEGFEKDGALGAVEGAGLGTVEGGLAGGVGELGGTLVGKAAKAGYDYLGKPLASTIRGLVNPEQEAARRVSGALARDYPQVSSGKTPGMTPTQWAQAKAADEPVMLGDLGGETTRALMRSAANTSPEGRAVLNQVIHDRFAQQSDRAGMTVRSLVSGGADSMKTKAQLEAEYDAERGGAYEAAYKAGDRPIWSPELERLAGSPAVTKAIRDAIGNWKDWQIRDGFGGHNSPIQITDDGRFIWSKGPSSTPSPETFWDRVQREQNFEAPKTQNNTYKTETGVPAYPNLQLWDYAQRNLSDAASRAARSGDNQTSSLIGGLTQQLKAELDKQVPEFADARGIAARYFGGNNAAEAGEKAINFKGDPRELKTTMAKMKPAEQGVFQEAYADALARKIEGVSDNRDVTNTLFNSPQARAKIGAVFGQGGVDRLQAFVNREKIYDAARKALGNSTTARQMIEAGLAGGAVGGFLSNGDPRTTLESAVGAAGIGMGAGASGLVRHGILTGARTTLGYVDRNTARHVAELLSSSDPQKLAAGLKMASRNQQINGRLADMAAKVSGTVGALNRRKVPISQLPQAINAENDQQNVPGIPPQKQDGGAVETENSFAQGGSVDCAVKTPKHTKAQADYKGGSKAKECSQCCKFIVPRGCKGVSGLISPHGVCKYFVREE